MQCNPHLRGVGRRQGRVSGWRAVEGGGNWCWASLQGRRASGWPQKGMCAWRQALRRAEPRAIHTALHRAEGFTDAPDNGFLPARPGRLLRSCSCHPPCSPGLRLSCAGPSRPSPLSIVPSFGSRLTRCRGTFWNGAYSTWHLRAGSIEVESCSKQPSTLLSRSSAREARE